MIRVEFPHQVVEHADLGIVLGDGCRLSARAWLPAAAGKYPAILEFLPYRKRDGTAERDALTHPYFAGHGYACLRVDMRGSGDSEGLLHDEYTQQELADAVEVIHWIAAQAWSNGRVGMMGISWGGFNALQVAALNPEPLKAIITLCSTVDRYADDIHYKGGCLLNENLGWGATMWSYCSRPPDPELVGDRWRELWLQRLHAQKFWPITWLQHQRRNDYWRHGSICEDYSAIKAATLAVGGWGDAYKNAVGEIVARLSAPAKGIIGPWVHKYPHFAVPEPRIGFLQEALRWWDRWLLERDTGVEQDPNLRIYVMEHLPPARWYERRPGRWLGLSAYPESSWTLEVPGTRLPVTINSPQDCGSEAGEYCAIWLGPEMPGEQSPDDSRSFCYDSAVLDEAMTIVGRPRVRLHLAAEQRSVKLVARLCAVAPDGASSRVSYGAINLAYCQWHSKSNKLLAELSFELDAIGYQLPAGHKLRLALSTSYWPLLWPAPGAGAVSLLQASLSLPLLAAEPEPVSFAAHESAAPAPLVNIRPAAHQREPGSDPASGVVSLKIVDDFGANRNEATGLTTGSVARELWSIHPDDPNSARGQCHWTQQLQRPGWDIRTEARAQMRSDADNFYLEAELEAFANGELALQKRLTESIARDGQ